MGRFESGAGTALMIFLPLILQVSPGFAAPLVIAQTETQAPPAAGAAPAPDAKSGQAPAQASTTPGAPAAAPAKKSALSVPVCSVKYLEAKVAGKLNGRQWVDFRRDECGAKDTTAVFPTAISPKYAGEKDVDKARRMTCADQFTANKATNANGGLKWIEKDGGYYGECISRLKS
jgi:hypothetical protein